MKSIRKKLFSINLALVMLLSVVIPVAAVEDEINETDTSYQITVGEETFQSNEKREFDTWNYNPDTSILWLDGYDGGAISADGNLDITVYWGGASILGETGHAGISVDGNLYITSYADVWITGGDDSTDDGIGGAGICATGFVQIYSMSHIYVNGGTGATGGSGLIGSATWVNGDCTINGGVANGVGIQYTDSCDFGGANIEVYGQPALKRTEQGSNVSYDVYHSTIEETETLIRISPMTFTTVLDGNGGFCNGEASVSIDKVYSSTTQSNLYLYDYLFERTGHVQTGWSRTENCEDTPEYDIDDYYWVGANTTLYAQWLAFGANDVLLYSNDRFFQKMSGAEITLPSDLESDDEDHRLIAWGTESSPVSNYNGIYSGDWYMPGEIITTDPTDGIKLYAFEGFGWERYIIYHPTDGKLNCDGSVIIQSTWYSPLIGEDYVTPPDGMELAGWSDTENGEVKYLPGVHIAGLASGQILNLYAVWQPIGTVSMLKTPEDLTWGKDYSNVESTTYESVPGIISWKVDGLTQNHYNIEIYRVDSNEDVNVGGAVWYMGATKIGNYSVFNFLDTEPGSEVSGDYYFTVQSLADGENYTDSEIATSTIWNYTVPDEQLPKLTNPVWDDNQMKWDIGDTTNVYLYEVEYLFAKTQNDNPVRYSMSWFSVESMENGFYGELRSNDIERNGAGLYYFRVRAISKDITTYRSSEWSDLSPAYDLREVTDQINSELDEIMDTASGDKKSETIQAVQAMDTEKLATAMAADNDGTGASSKIAELEEKIGTTAAVDVTKAPEEFQRLAREISAVGAGLNATEENQKVILKIDAPAETHVLAAQYSNSVEFSMQLVDDAGDEVSTEGRQLAVPVKITLPIPNSINPMSIVVLHHHADDTTEVIHPYITMKDGQWYATFVVTSFSDFEFVNPAVTTLENGIRVSTKVQGENVSSVLCAAYDADGKQLEIGTMTPGENGLWSVEITCDPAEVDHVKVFAMDSQNCPVAAEKTITVSVSVAE